MVNWKELGEIPDSEDEDAFDSQHLDTAPPVALREFVEDQNGQQDIWDVPLSQEDERVRQQPGLAKEKPTPIATQSTPNSSPLTPLSSLATEDELPDVELLLVGQRKSQASDPRSPENTSLTLPLVDEISTSYVEITSPTPVFVGAEEDAQPQPTSQGPSHKSPLQSQELGQRTEEQAARQIGIRFERSLRPRKPIQEHPYLLENAHYSSFLKEHGVKPLRMAIEAERRRRETTVNEDEFDPESQGSGLPDASDPNQRDNLDDFLAELGTLDVASSSPLQTSPLVDKAGPSSPTGTTHNTDNTSIHWDDLPALEDLLLRPQRSAKKSTPEKGVSPSQSASRKRRRHDIIDSDPAEPRPARVRIADSPDPILSVASEHEDHRLAIIGHSPSAQQESSSRPRVTILDDESDVERPSPDAREPQVDAAGSDGRRTETESSDGSESASESGSEIVNKVGRRIRGVLPASWLRIDQQSSRAKLQQDTSRRKAFRSPEREQRRGVAQRRQPLAGSSTNQIFFDDSDDEPAPSRLETTDDKFHNQMRLLVEEVPDSPTLALETPAGPDDFSDDGSVVEIDHVDRMLPGRKRQLKLSDSFGSQKKRPRSSKDVTRKPMRKAPKQQPKITNAFASGNADFSSRRVRKQARRSSEKRTSGKGKGNRRAAEPVRSPKAPLLSILDVIESNAPQFLKIAARTARRRGNQGRGSPRRKHIQLATRQDHVDAASVLNDWRAGSIRPRQSVTAARKEKQQHRQARPLAERSVNIQAVAKVSSEQPPASARKLVRHISDGQTVSYQAEAGQNRLQTPKPFRSTSARHDLHRGYARPAQLEMDAAEQNSFVFHTTKKLLDRIYRKKSRKSPLESSVGPSQVNKDLPSWPDTQGVEETHMASEAPVVTAKEMERSRPRKKKKPRRVDVDEPQYRHANDPLPVELPVEQVTIASEVEGAKLLGLGPYGTHYTHHFEVFPLSPGVYFHESTIIGSGIFEAIANHDQSPSLMESRPRVSYGLGDQTLQWGQWDAQVSSELGIVLDFIADQLEECAQADFIGTTKGVDAAAFIMKYVKESVAVTDENGIKLFAARINEALRVFNERIESWLKGLEHVAQGVHETLIRIYDRLLLTAFLVLKISRESSSMMEEQFQLEELVQNLAKFIISSLLRLGLTFLRKSYEDQNSLRLREKGIRDNAPALHSWVLVSKVLELSYIPRASFWDVTQAAIASPDAVSSIKVPDLERLWESMFALLPLIEFNDTGVIISGRRHDATADGWALPQKLLRQVFQLYRDNDRQPPGFNTYCRALVGRCHYLVQQWGWRKSSSVVGVIFDFFGSQNLAHLRNEEVYKSPRFLEQLATQPSLEIEPDDRCFHVFLKLVALSIRKLNEVGSIKDIRNLVARTMPNHNRQHLKEQKIHERDLAALRNHHDLLCTLFWAAPPNLRPSISLFERLVVPASSHKEACLINLRAWNQLARFVVVKGDMIPAFKPFAQWRDRFFQQIMHQFDSVASDIQQQLLALSKDVSKSIGQDVISAMVSMNKKAVIDVLHMSVTASLDVMRHCSDLESAMFALNTLQLQQVFKHFAVAPPELDWSIVQACITVVDIVLSKIDDFKDNEESQQSFSNILTLAQADDALLVLDHDIAGSFFSMARCVLSSRGSKNLTAVEAMDRVSCTERVVALSARLGARFISAGVITLPDMFKFGKHGLFEDVPSKISLDQRRYLVLFMAKLLEHGFDSFADAHFALPELWALSIVKPRAYLTYESRLAQQLRRYGKDFVPEAIVGLATSLDYNTNRDLFECVISWMRESVRDAGPSLRKVLTSEHSKTLRLVMEQAKSDLRAVASDASEHHGYVCFVRDIIALIKSHGSDFCVVDDFFYQISKEYSPSVQDPQLQVAGMVSYGLRLAEDEAKVVHQLFFFLFNNFKLAMINDKLGEEVRMLRKGLKNAGIRGFVLGKMLPAMIQATAKCHDVFPLLNVYTEALHLLLAGKAVAHELTVDDLPNILMTLKAAMNGVSEMGRESGAVGDAEMYVLLQVLATLNTLWPPLFVLSLQSPHDSIWDEISTVMQTIRDFIRPAAVYLEDVRQKGITHDRSMLLACPDLPAWQLDQCVTTFTSNIMSDVRRNWTSVGNRITIQAPGKARGTTSTQSGQGIQRPAWETKQVLEGLRGSFRVWNGWWEKMYGEIKCSDDDYTAGMTLFF